MESTTNAVTDPVVDINNQTSGDLKGVSHVVEMDIDDDSTDKIESINTCEITLDISEDENLETGTSQKQVDNQLAEKQKRREILQQMEDERIDYDDDSISIDADPEFSTEDEVVKESQSFKKYWKTVMESPNDFTAWTYLLQLVEEKGQLSLTRRAYNGFFKRYPLCYGYWKKFSEVERKNGNAKRARKVLERGVRAIPLSVDLWAHVADFYIKHYQGSDAGVEKVRTVFKRAIRAAGGDFRSEKLWKKYISYEVENKQFIQALEIYDQVLKTQTQYCQNFHNEFSDFVRNHNPVDLLKELDFEKALMTARASIASEAAKRSLESAENSENKNEEEELDEGPPGVEDHEKPPNEEELKHIRNQIILERKEVHEATLQAVTKIWTFEEGIKRPYFHVKQLERVQLKNWREYLDAEIADGNHERIVLLFERCLIACALYEDFWLKYARYMVNHDVNKARSIYQRACCIHLPKKPNIHIQWASFEEMNGDIDKAAWILESLDASLQGVTMIKMRRVAIARRAGKLQTAESYLRSYVASATKEKEELFYTRKLAWFLYKLVNNRVEARQLIKGLIAKYNSEVKLYSDLVEMEFHNADVGLTDADEQLAIEAFDLALNSDALTEDQKFAFSQKKLEYMEDFGIDVKLLQKAYDEHQKLSKLQKKRAAEQAATATVVPTATTAAVAVEEPVSKKAKVDTNGQIPTLQTSSAAAAVSNGIRYMTNTASAYTTATTQAQQQTTYAATDPSASYYSQNYWNYQQQGKATEAQQYNYAQWSQYYGSR